MGKGVIPLWTIVSGQAICTCHRLERAQPLAKRLFRLPRAAHSLHRMRNLCQGRNHELPLRRRRRRGLRRPCVLARLLELLPHHRQARRRLRLRQAFGLLRCSSCLLRLPLRLGCPLLGLSRLLVRSVGAHHRRIGTLLRAQCEA